VVEEEEEEEEEKDEVDVSSFSGELSAKTAV